MGIKLYYCIGCQTAWDVSRGSLCIRCNQLACSELEYARPIAPWIDKDTEFEDELETISEVIERG